MKITKFVLWGAIYFFYISLSFGQNKIVEHKTIYWQEPIKTTTNGSEDILFRFSNTGENIPPSNLPILYESIALPQGIEPKSVKVQMINKQFIWPTPEEHSNYLNRIKNDSIDINLTISQEGNQYYAEISFSPVLKKPDAPSFHKLWKYELEITYQFNETSLLKSSEISERYAENSVLSEGNWFKVKVSESGIHKINYSMLQSWGVTNPSNVAIYGNGGKMLPQSNSEYREDDLVENGIWHYNNAIYFYAEGPAIWKYDSSKSMFTHSIHQSSNYSYYFLTEKSVPGKQIDNSEIYQNPNTEVNYYNSYSFHENNSINLIKSGSTWFGEKFDPYKGTTQNFSFSFPNLLINEPAKVEIKCAARSNTYTYFTAKHNNTTLSSGIFGKIKLDDHIGYYAREGLINGFFTPSSTNINITLDYVYTPGSAQNIYTGYLDYICINTKSKLSFIQNQLQFRNIDVVQADNITLYNIESSSKNLVIWDITNPHTTKAVVSNKSDTLTSFIYDASELKEFIAFDPSGNFSSPELVGQVTNQNLHALPNADYIIVCHPDFKAEAKRLGEIHSNHRGLSYIVATTKQIYNEFSSGMPDVTALRSFVKMFYDRAEDNNEQKPKYLLLFGDGSYDNRPDISGNTNKIPTYQSNNSVYQIESYVSDDYFGLLDDTEGANIQYEKIDIGIGRFPVNTLEEAKNAVDRTELYLTQQSSGVWKSKITFAADDEDDKKYNNISLHMRDADDIATNNIEHSHPKFQINKIYFDKYQKVTSSVNKRYPEVETEIYNSLHEGSLIFNYTGHGATHALAHELVVTKSHINTWKNINKLPIFITATCEFSRFDEKEETSAGEMIFLNKFGGGIVLFSTTRIVYSSGNKTLNNNIYNNIFELDTDGTPLSFGEIMRRTKNSSGSTVNKLNFTLLGDPALQPIYPKFDINTISLNHDSIITGDSSFDNLDTLKALSKNYLKGQILDKMGEIDTTFNGEVFISIYDKKSHITTLNNNNFDSGPFEYDTYESIIFKGISEVANGKFESEFMIPKDIRYNLDYGKISYYAYSDDNKEAFGAFDKIKIGGFATNPESDNTGPTISVWLNNKSFNNGDNVKSTPLLIADISDENGINTTGSGIGHDISCILNNDKSNPRILNSYFEANLNTYQSGSIYYQLPSLEPGSHTLTLKAWDTFNNSSERTISFKVEDSNTINIQNSIIYPNPVTSGNSSFFSFVHDEPNTIFDIDVYVYDLNGQIVSSQNTSVVSLNNTVPPIEWQPISINGQPINPGLYIYKLVVKSQTQRNGEISGKIMVSK
jgi:hypothetical protein